MRGAAQVPRVLAGGRGTNPAGAGSRPGRPTSPAVSGDHPRGCGEQWDTALPRMSVAGPSPRVRGAGRRRPGLPGARGTIPAGAGSRTVCRRHAVAVRDHPRGCGEQSAVNCPPRYASGPSPRVRGAVFSLVGLNEEVGTIPAGAGSSRSSRAPARRGRDHPRGCGEQQATPEPELWAWGPSPRVRGAALSGLGLGLALGTIPAGAGSSAGTPRRPPPTRDHPRGCGEQFVPNPQACDLRGPSPRVRGAGSVHRSSFVVGGTIPAGAGSRARSMPPGRRARDHPRGCGEQSTLAKSGQSPLGPSPRVRGAETSQITARMAAGTIPAGAGSRADNKSNCCR